MTKESMPEKEVSMKSRLSLLFFSLKKVSLVQLEIKI